MCTFLNKNGLRIRTIKRLYKMSDNKEKQTSEPLKLKVGNKTAEEKSITVTVRSFSPPTEFNAKKKKT